jgi:hypothetical protein
MDDGKASAPAPAAVPASGEQPVFDPQGVPVFFFSSVFRILGVTACVV